jgi:hypothetical protein
VLAELLVAESVETPLIEASMTLGEIIDEVEEAGSVSFAEASDS